MRRCPFGFPAAVETLPADASGTPFPTLFYATCPTLVAAVGALESRGAVRRFERRLRDEPALARSLVAATRAARRRRRDLAAAFDLRFVDDGASLRTGIGGVLDTRTLKCLHAHAAHALAHPGYLLGAAVLNEAGPLWCEDGRCSAFEDAASSGVASRAASSTAPARRGRSCGGMSSRRFRRVTAE